MKNRVQSLCARISNCVPRRRSLALWLRWFLMLLHEGGPVAGVPPGVRHVEVSWNR